MTSLQAITGYDSAVQAMKRIGLSLVDCDVEPYFLGSPWWWIGCDKESWWFNSKTGTLLEIQR
jgi:hypothetical protein